MTNYTITEDQIKYLLQRLSDADEVVCSVDTESDDYTKGAPYANGYAHSAIQGTILELARVLANGDR